VSERAAVILYRRSPHLVCYWSNGQFLFHNYAFRTRTAAGPLACEILDFFEDWKPIAALFESKQGYPPEGLADLVLSLMRARLLQRSDQPLAPEEEAMSRLDRWNPEAGFFHSGTKDVEFLDIRAGERQLRRQARTWPMPDPIKRYPGAPRVKLGAVDRSSPTAQAFLGRRSWRQFGKGKIPLPTFATLLGLTAGVQKWLTASSGQRVALKTSPSGGARHPIELYTLAWGIEGLPRGLYHYAADTHELELVKRGLGSKRVPAYLPHGEYWSDACAVILFSAVYERDIWRYPYSRAYRAPFIEAGHLCQTFLVLASDLGLAPFCAMALADSVIERDLGVDGVGESVLYAAGVGVRPPGTQSATEPRGFKPPKVEVNPHLSPTTPHRRTTPRRRPRR
jgi:SagB-type dehydrogenase family enzyme